MKEPFIFYRAVDAVKGSWDGYGFFPLEDGNFLAFVTDAPSGASIHTPELIKDFWAKYCGEAHELSYDPQFAKLELADAINKLQNVLQQRGRKDAAVYQATLSIARKAGQRLYYCSIGDSTLQILRGEKLYRLNETEIWDGSLIISQNDVLRERQKTKTLRMIGSSGDFLEASRISSMDLLPGDLLMMNTDGVEDLISPERFIPIVHGTHDEMRKQLEQIFAQDKLKDDVTFLAAEIEVDAPFIAEKQIAAIRSQVDSMDDEQQHLRNEIGRLSEQQTRIEKLERGLQSISQQIQSMGKPAEVPKAARAAAAPAPDIRVVRQPEQTKPWFWIAGAFLAGLVIGLGFFLFNSRPQPAPQRPAAEETMAKTTEPRTEPVAPPDIPAPVQCTYTVEKGDTLDRIASKKSIPVATLIKWNPGLHAGTILKAGQKLAVCEEP